MASDTDLPDENAEAERLADEAGVERRVQKRREESEVEPTSVPADESEGTSRAATGAPHQRTKSGHLRLVTADADSADTESADAASDDAANAPATREPFRSIEDPDVDLVERAKGGDQRAFAALFDRHHGRVFAMCCRLLRDRVEVEDAVQHAFLEAWRCLHKFEGRSKFSTWITRIAIHTCLGIRRRLKRMFLSEDVRPVEIADDDGQWGSAPMAPDEGAAHHARKRAVDDVLQLLSAKKRVVFVLAELEGMTAPEIAEILQIPDATVRTRLFHARKEFAQKVEAHPGFADLFGGAS